MREEGQLAEQLQRRGEKRGVAAVERVVEKELERGGEAGEIQRRCLLEIAGSLPMVVVPVVAVAVLVPLLPLLLLLMTVAVLLGSIDRSTQSLHKKAQIAPQVCDSTRRCG